MTTDPTPDRRARIVAAIKSSPFEELRTVDYAPNGPLQITVRVDALADTLLRALAVPAVPAGRDALRDRIAEGLYVHNHPGWALRYGDLDQDERDTYLARADAVVTVLPPPADRAAEEAYRLALSTALRLGTGANWEAIRDRAEDLVADRNGLLLWAADQIDVETRRAKMDGVLEPDKYRPCRDASAQLRALADCHECSTGAPHTVHCPTPETHNWGCGCPTDQAPESVARRMADEARQQTETPASTADKAAAQGLTATEYRARSHQAAMDAIRAALPSLYAHIALRVEDALAPQLPNHTVNEEG